MILYMKNRLVNFCNKILPDILKTPIVSYKKTSCYNYVAAFDIETTNDDQTRNSFLYTGQFAFGSNGEHSIIVRSWDDVIDILRYLDQHINQKLIIYVHNLSYEIQFLQGVYEFKKEDLFCLDFHKVLYANMFDHICFRCSYQLTGYSLAKFCSEMGVANQKVKGFDYDKIRYPWTKLTNFEKSYILNDVIGLCQALSKFIFDIHHMDLASIPLTATGFVRRDVKAILEEITSKNKLKIMQPDPYLHQMLRYGFRGGDTHGNRYYANQILEAGPDEKLLSKDESSAYPFVMCCKELPYGEMRYCGKKVTLDAIEYKISVGYAVLFKVTFESIELKDRYDGCPYIPLSKTLYRPDFAICDNGRIIDGKGVSMVLTDLDYKIIKDTYNFKIYQIEDVYQCKYKMLPEEIRKYIIQLYRNKTLLKYSDPVTYMVSKGKINSCYGMIVQNLLKPMIIYLDGLYVYENKEMKELYQKLLQSPFIPYQVGVWVTAWARYCLYEGRKAIGSDAFIYSDTDSIKYFERSDNKDAFNKINEERKQLAIKYGAWADDEKGIRHYMGIYEDDGEYHKFKFLGAKKYCYTDTDDHLHLTLAGVQKKAGAIELGNIDNFKLGFVFKDSAGLCARYNDKVDRWIERDGHRIHLTRNLYLSKTEYTLDITQEYKDCIDFAAGQYIDLLTLFDNIDNQ